MGLWQNVPGPLFDVSWAVAFTTAISWLNFLSSVVSSDLMAFSMLDADAVLAEIAK